MNFDRDLVEFHYSNILNGFTPFIFDGALYYGRHISTSQIFESNSRALQFKQEYIKNGLQSEYEILRELAANEIWTFDDEQEIILLESQIKDKSKTLSLIFLPTQIKQIRDEIDRLNEKLREKRRKRQDCLTNSIEYKVSADKNEYLIYLSIYKSQEERAWQSFEDFLNEDSEFVEKIMSAYCQCLNQVNSLIIRAIAKSTDARHRIKMCSFANLSNISMFLMDLKQWCAFYDNIYELTDRPEEEVIQDDDKLDGWIETRRAKAKLENSVNNSEGFASFPGATKADMEALGGKNRKAALEAAKQDKV